MDNSIDEFKWAEDIKNLGVTTDNVYIGMRVKLTDGSTYKGQTETSGNVVTKDEEDEFPMEWMANDLRVWVQWDDHDEGYLYHYSISFKQDLETSYE